MEQKPERKRLEEIKQKSIDLITRNAVLHQSLGNFTSVVFGYSYEGRAELESNNIVNMVDEILQNFSIVDGKITDMNSLLKRINKEIYSKETTKL